MASAPGRVPGRAAHAAHIVGAPLTTVTPCLAIDSSADCGSKRSTSSTDGPGDEATARAPR